MIKNHISIQIPVAIMLGFVTALSMSFKPQLTNFLPVKLISNAAGNLLAMPVHTNTSGDFASLSGTDGYVELALEQSDFKAGTTVPLHRWRL